MNPSTGNDPAGDTGTPRWVKVFGIAAIAVLIVFVVLLLTGGTSHGPGRHAPPSEMPATEPPGSESGGDHAGPPPGVTHP